MKLSACTVELCKCHTFLHSFLACGSWELGVGMWELGASPLAIFYAP